MHPIIFWHKNERWENSWFNSLVQKNFSGPIKIIIFRLITARCDHVELGISIVQNSHLKMVRERRTIIDDIVLVKVIERLNVSINVYGNSMPRIRWRITAKQRSWKRWPWMMRTTNWKMTMMMIMIQMMNRWRWIPMNQWLTRMKKRLITRADRNYAIEHRVNTDHRLPIDILR